MLVIYDLGGSDSRAREALLQLREAPGILFSFKELLFA